MLQTSAVQAYLVDKVTSRLSEQFHTKISVGGVNIGLWKNLMLKDFIMLDQQNDTLIYAKQLNCHIKQFSDKKGNLVIKKVGVDGLISNIYRLNNDSLFNYSFLINKNSNDSVEATSLGAIICDEFKFEHSSFKYRDDSAHRPINLLIEGINFEIEHLALGDSSIAFGLNELSFRQHNGINIQMLKGEVRLNDQHVELKDVALETDYSKLNLSQLWFDLKKYTTTGSVGDIELGVDLTQTTIAFEDIALFDDQFSGLDLNVSIRGKLSGKIDNLKGRNWELSFGEFSKLKCQFYLDGLTNPENSFLDLDVKEAITSFEDISSIQWNDSTISNRIHFPQGFYDAGIISYRGKFTGFTTDFVAFGTIESDLGSISSDLSFKPNEKGDIQIDGHLKSVNFEAGKLLGNQSFGAITLNGEVNGIKPVDGVADVQINGIIDSLDINDYRLRNIRLNGEITERRFDGELRVNDQNVELDFLGKIDLTQKEAVVDFESNLKYLDLAALRLVPEEQIAVLQSKINANFKAATIDSVVGNINITDTYFTNENGSLSLQDLLVTTHVSKDFRQMSISSDYLDGKIEGEFVPTTLVSSFKQVINRYIPSLHLANGDTLSRTNRFEYDFEVKDINEISAILFPDLKMETPFTISGSVDDKNNDLVVDATIPSVEYQQKSATKLRLSTGKDNNGMRWKIKADQFKFAEGLNLFNFSCNSEAKSDTLSTVVSWNNWDEETYSGHISFQTILHNNGQQPKVDIHFNPSQIYVADSLWNIASSSVVIDGSQIEINNFDISQGDQHIKIDGQISEDKTKSLVVDVKEIHLNMADHILGEKSGMSGEVNGNVNLFDFYGDRLFFSNLKIDGLVFKNYNIGNIQTDSRWDSNLKKVIAELTVTQDSVKVVDMKGEYDPAHNSIDFHSKVDGVNMNVLDLVMDPNSLSQLEGRAYGHMRVFGQLPDIKLEGALLGKNAGITINFLKSHYTLSDTVYFEPDRMIFDQIVISDKNGKTGVFNGDIKHEAFANMIYNLAVTTEGIQILNTTNKDNEKFYGDAFAKGVVRITGAGQLVQIGGAIETVEGTEIIIPVDDEEDLVENTFVHFVDKDKKDQATVLNSYAGNGVEVNIDLDVTPEAKVRLLMESYYGGKLSGVGHGNLKLAMDKFGKFDMYGEVAVDKGDFEFRLQNVISKNFDIHSGGTLRWNGDPYEADISLEGIYRVRASIKDLPLQELLGIDPSEDLPRSRIPVECIINLKGMLTAPDVSFDVSLPSAEPRMRDAFDMLISNQEDLNRQILMLLVMRRFYTPPQYKGTSATSNEFVGNSASELLSNQLSNWLSQISENWDWGFNYRLGNEVTSDEVEVALSTQLFDDRLLINGNVGNNASPSSSQSGLTGDFDVVFKYTNRLHLKAFSRTNDNVIHDTSPTTQGIGISYREDFDTWRELFQRYTRWLRPKRSSKGNLSKK